MPLTLHELTETVLGCVCAALQDTAAQVPGQPGCPCRACVVPGQPAWDWCDDPCGDKGDGGQLSVHVIRLFPTNPFPTEDRSVMGSRNCPMPSTTAAEIAVTVLRCAPTPDEEGCPPSCDELDQAARVLHVDSMTVFNALYCCLNGSEPGRRRGRKYVMGQQRTVGPQGGCVGIEQRVTVALPGCWPCPEDSP
ncbi:hypothetical protein E0L36_21885 [Streptomyces sp. AJS327]|uniref:hypothetical protein n=1 Tax=Streptomyces sp. AJS327 TaxID=2545265 RepID=UPI0015E0196F|nr:hypothetical protein [Streptomyces sp. AJS327]MBA0053428.1 hypothetical protein [Streptomyces sp. AJS327]